MDRVFERNFDDIPCGNPPHISKIEHFYGAFAVAPAVGLVLRAFGLKHSRKWSTNCFVLLCRPMTHHSSHHCSIVFLFSCHTRTCSLY